MTQEFGAGEWIADGVLAALGEDPETTRRVASPEVSTTLHHHANPYSNTPTTMGSESFQPPEVNQSVHQQLVKAGHRLLPVDLTSTWASASTGTSKPNADDEIGKQIRSAALVERPVATDVDPKRQMPIKQFSSPSKLPLAPSQQRSLSTQAGANVPNPGSLPGGVRVQGIRVMHDNCAGTIETAPSKPRAMLKSATVRTENNRPIARIEPRPILSSLRHQDLVKWPCRHCHFVHKGGECEKNCIGCGSKLYDRHDLFCPFKDKVRYDENLTLPNKKEPMPIKEAPSQYRTPDPNPSYTMQLSLECQRRGFNPEFKYYRGKDERDNRADLFIKDILISGGGISYISQKDARDALALKGLEVVRKMECSQPIGGSDISRIMDNSTMHSAPNTGSRSIGSPSFANASSFRSQNTPYRPFKKRASFTENKDAVRGMIKSAQSPLPWKQRPANTIVSAGLAEPKRLEHSQQVTVKGNVVLELPTNIKSYDARATVERAVIANPNTNISLHFPANVSVEIAQAYGLAIGAIANSSHQRSRSRSPLRETRQDYRDRERERERDRDRNRDHDRANEYYNRGTGFHQSRPSFWPPRASTDAYRPPSAGAVLQNRAEYHRLRLSLPPESSKHYPPRNGRDPYSQDRPERR